MKIKVAILEKDKGYLARLVSAFGTRYAEELEIYSFTDAEIALEAMEINKINVLLASDAFEFEPKQLPKNRGFAYLVESPGVAMLRDQIAVCKFQKAELIYKEIVRISADYVDYVGKPGENGTVIAFASPAGGVGTSTVAAGCALHYAKAGKKVLYLNLETFGSADIFFQGQGNFSLSDIIFTLKKKANLDMKLESCSKQDDRGVTFYSGADIVLDRLELKNDEILEMLKGIRRANYDYIILDLDFSLDRGALEILRQAQALVWVNDGSQAANEKTIRAYRALATMEANAELPLTNRMGIIYNRFSSHHGEMAKIDELRLIGGAQVFAGGTTQQVLEQLAAMDMYDKIF